MPLVRMLTSWASQRHAFHDGEHVQASAEEAQAWLDGGIAELVRDVPPDTPEGRAARPETTDRRRRRA